VVQDSGSFKFNSSDVQHKLEIIHRISDKFEETAATIDDCVEDGGRKD